MSALDKKGLWVYKCRWSCTAKMIADGVSHETIRRVLQDTDLKPWLKEDRNQKDVLRQGRS